MKLLRRFQGRQSDPERHIESPHSGFLLSQDTYFVGTIKGGGSTLKCARYRTGDLMAFIIFQLSRHENC